jgi:PIN domain nuclease of toxin-antitoxin system
MIVLDTHALLWWALDPERLSDAACTTLAEMERHGGYASAISIWEIATKVKRAKLELPFSVEELVRRIEKGAIVELLAVDTTTWLRSVSLPWEHRDPADRVIVATALSRGVPLLTKDAAMHSYPEIRCIW